ncbi:peptidase C39 family protein [Stackebrandtia soli]|uniref:peptidase C39 family protein n=1 Tax=Stackebrandtia soli TaxID=1892856 RepID=UPI0039E91998
MSNAMSRRAVLTAGLAAGSSILAAGAASAEESAALTDVTTMADADIDFREWASTRQWHEGEAQGVKVDSRGGRPGIRFHKAVDSVEYTDPHTDVTANWDIAVWTSPWYEIGFGATEVIPSWNAETPAGSWLQVELAARYDDGADSEWFVMGRWASGETDIRRTSVDGQGDPRATIWTDTFSIDDPDAHRVAAYRFRLTLHRTPGSDVRPRVWRIGALASTVPDRFDVPESTPGVARGLEVDVPQYSQSIHSGQYPEYGGGGQAWCSPTSSQMIIESFGRKADPEDYTWVDPSYADRQICHAARQTFDAQYDGCGNWPFNAAYAATYEDMDAIVTRIGSLDEAEALIAAGFPIITSQSFLKEELDGAGYGTAGHLMTLIGFTEDGDVIANDPASPTNEAVRHVYNRRQFENIWLRTKRYNASGSVVGASGGVCYLYKSTDREWPTLPGVPGLSGC